MSCKEIRIEPTVPKLYYGCFYIGTFKNGQALTVANALRRTLLSEISGLAITGVQIDGVLHEYSTLPGIRETVLDILLNLKEIILKKTIQHPLKKTQIGYLNARGPGPVRASDLKLPPMIQIVDPEQYIATLSGEGNLNVRLIIEEGKEFMTLKKTFSFDSNDNQNLKNTKFLSIEAIFSPIKKVNYIIESKGSESLQPANEIISLEIWTNGSLCPKEAISKSLNYLRILFNEIGKLKVLESNLTTYSLKQNQNFYKLNRTINIDLDNWNLHSLNLAQQKSEQSLTVNTPSSNLLKEEKNPNVSNNRNLQKIEDLGLPFRIFRSFVSMNIVTVGDLLKKQPRELQKIGLLTESDLLILTKILYSKGLMFETEL